MTHTLLNWWRDPHPRCRTVVRRTSRLRVECLEERAVPATYTVTTGADVVAPADGLLSLREAVRRSNNHAGTDIIVLPAGICRVGLAGAGEDANATGDFDITDTVLIRGAGVGVSFVEGRFRDRVFDVSGTDPIRLVLQGLTVRTGQVDGDGGGVRLGNANLVVRDAALAGNRASGSGGAISSTAAGEAGDVTLVRAAVAGNTAGSSGGGVHVAGDGSLTVQYSSVRQNVAVGSGEDTTATSYGGGIYAGVVTLTSSTVSGNSANSRGHGGGIYATTATLTGCTVSRNTAGGNGPPGFGGGIYATTVRLTGCTVGGNATGNFGFGGGIYATTVRLTGCTVSGNSAPGSDLHEVGTGGGIQADRATLFNCTITGNSAGIGGGGIEATTATLTDCTISDNSANLYGDGGGIEATTATLTRCTLTGNTAVNGGGVSADTAELLDCTFRGNKATGQSSRSGETPGRGGAVHATTATLTNCRVNGNTAHGDGGGIYADSATLTDSTVAGNSATPIEHLAPNTYSDGAGGGIHATTATLTGCTVSGNTAVSGGGILAGTAELTNSTVSGNRAVGQSGFYTGPDPGSGGGIYADSATLLNCTVVQNSALAGGGGAFHNPGGTFAVRNTIIALNVVDPTGTGPDVFGEFVGGWHNLIGDGTGGTGFANGVGGDIVGTSASPIDPRIGALANNGGRTRTHALLAGSPAIDRGDNAALSLDQTTDQRGPGFPRQKDGNGDGIRIVDIGAFEL